MLGIFGLAFCGALSGGPRFKNDNVKNNILPTFKVSFWEVTRWPQGIQMQYLIFQKEPYISWSIFWKEPYNFWSIFWKEPYIPSEKSHIHSDKSPVSLYISPEKRSRISGCLTQRHELRMPHAETRVGCKAFNCRCLIFWKEPYIFWKELNNFWKEPYVFPQKRDPFFRRYMALSKRYRALVSMYMALFRRYIGLLSKDASKIIGLFSKDTAGNIGLFLEV